METLASVRGTGGKNETGLAKLLATHLAHVSLLPPTGTIGLVGISLTTRGTRKPAGGAGLLSFSTEIGKTRFSGVTVRPSPGFNTQVPEIARLDP